MTNSSSDEFLSVHTFPLVSSFHHKSHNNCNLLYFCQENSSEKIFARLLEMACCGEKKMKCITKRLPRIQSYMGSSDRRRAGVYQGGNECDRQVRYNGNERRNPHWTLTK